MPGGVGVRSDAVASIPSRGVACASLPDDKSQCVLSVGWDAERSIEDLRRSRRVSIEERMSASSVPASVQCPNDSFESGE